MTFPTTDFVKPLGNATINLTTTVGKIVRFQSHISAPLTRGGKTQLMTVPLRTESAWRDIGNSNYKL